MSDLLKFARNSGNSPLKFDAIRPSDKPFFTTKFGTLSRASAVGSVWFGRVLVQEIEASLVQTYDKT